MGIVYRQATATDMPGIARVRFSVIENAVTPEQLAARGITNETVAASFATTAKGWVAEHRGEIVGFSIADRESRSIFALFVLPAFERRGIGSQLLDLAVHWLWQSGIEHAWLNTGPQTKAAAFYQRRGWLATGPAPHGDARYECARPANWRVERPRPPHK